ncbi:MAG: RNA polymerase sigma factor [Burkholderiales bacterium]
MNAHATTVSAPDDQALAQRCAQGDVAAFTLVMRRYNQRLFRVARAALRDDAEAEDALQDAYVRAFRAFGQFRGEAALSTWLTRIVLNECLARRRRSARRENVVPITGAGEAGVELDEIVDTAGERPEAMAMRTELRALLEAKLDALPHDLRTVFVMRSVEDMTVEEVARCLDAPEATVRSRHFRARALLREALARELDAVEIDAFRFAGDRCDRIVATVLARLRDPG